jgi:hypothetical protein
MAGMERGEFDDGMGNNFHQALDVPWKLRRKDKSPTPGFSWTINQR